MPTTVLTVQLRGQRQVAAFLNGLARRNPRAAQSAVRTVGEVDLTEMKKRTPVALGNLRDTGRIEETDGIGIRWAFGGTTVRNVFVDYAVEVHENLEMFHRVGQAKYMESVLSESFPHYEARIGREWALEMGL